MTMRSPSRREARKPLDVYLNKFIGEEPYMVRAADISTSGIFLYKLIEPNLSEGTTVNLEFMLPTSSEVLWACGEVVREDAKRGANGIGIGFTVLPDTYRKLIERYIHPQGH